MPGDRCQHCTAVTIRRLTSQEASLHRALRLRALTDTPYAFGETLSVTAARPFLYWEILTRQLSNDHGPVMLLTETTAGAMGFGYGLLDHHYADRGRVGGIWVEPTWRGRGLGQQLVLAIQDWARERGLQALDLWVSGDAVGALLLYHRLGFVPTGDVKPSPVDPVRPLLAMRCSLT